MTLGDSKPQRSCSASCGNIGVNRRGPHSYPRLGSLHESFTRSFSAMTEYGTLFVGAALCSTGFLRCIKLQDECLTNHQFAYSRTSTGDQTKYLSSHIRQTSCTAHRSLAARRLQGPFHYLTPSNTSSIRCIYQLIATCFIAHGRSSTFAILAAEPTGPTAFAQGEERTDLSTHIHLQTMQAPLVARDV